MAAERAGARFVKSSEILNRQSRDLPKLSVGKRCFVQNQTGTSPNKWDRTGVVTEVNPHDQYTIKIDGSGRLTTRNRKYLRVFEPTLMNIQPSAPPLPSTAHKSSPEFCPLPPENTMVKNMFNNDQDINIDQDVPIPSAVSEESIDDNFVDGPEVETSVTREVAEPMGKLTKLPNACKRLIPHNKDGSKVNNLLPYVEGRCLRNRTIVKS